MNDTSKVRQKMIDARKKKKLTQLQLGELVGTSYSNIAKIEKGVSNPSLDLAKGIAKVLRIKLTDL